MAQSIRDTMLFLSQEVVPADVPTDFPADVPADLPADVPTDLPADVPTDLPADVPVDASADTSANVSIFSTEYTVEDSIEDSTEDSTEYPTELSLPEFTQDFLASPENQVSYIVGDSSLDEQILQELEVTNNLLGMNLAVMIFFLGLFFLVFFIKVIKNNVTKFLS